MLQFLRRYWPSTLRVRLMLILLPVVGLPIIATGYILKLRGQEILIEEKRQHLQGINALLDQYPTGDFEGFDGIGIKSLLLRQEKFIALTQTQKRRFVL